MSPPSTEEVLDHSRAITGIGFYTFENPEFDWRVGLYNCVANRFTKGRSALVGDAAHTMIPVSAQGMNTGVQDALALGWGLARAVRSGDPQHLEGYGRERRPIAQGVVDRGLHSYWGGVGRLPTYESMQRGVERTSSVREPVALRQGAPVEPSGDGRLGIGDRLPDTELVAGDGRALRLLDVMSMSGAMLLWDAEPGLARMMALALDPLGVPLAVCVGGSGDAASLADLRDPSGVLHRRLGAARQVIVRPDGRIGYLGPTLPVGKAIAAVKEYVA